MKRLTIEEENKLSQIELIEYYEKFRNYEWSKLTIEEKKESILSNYEFLIDKRGIEDITLEEQIEFALRNKPSEKANYVTSLVKHYYSIRKKEKFTFFWQTKSPFSQWHKTKFTASTCLNRAVSMNQVKREYVLQNVFPIDVQEYSSTEQFMMYHKAIVFLDIDSAQKIMMTDNVRKIKELGRKVKNFDERVWKYHRSDIVYEGNKAKFSQNEDLNQALLATKDTTLVEAAPNDKIWGIGLAADDTKAKKRETWEGKNLLGEILTILRMEFMGMY